MIPLHVACLMWFRQENRIPFELLSAKWSRYVTPFSHAHNGTSIKHVERVKLNPTATLKTQLSSVSYRTCGSPSGGGAQISAESSIYFWWLNWLSNQLLTAAKFAYWKFLLSFTVRSLCSTCTPKTVSDLHRQIFASLAPAFRLCVETYIPPSRRTSWRVSNDFLIETNLCVTPC